MTSQKNKIILVVDDNLDILSFVTDCIAKMGQEVISAANGEEAVEIIKNHKVGVDLLISDIVMPGMNGIELANELTTNAPAAKIIFMSGYMKPASPFSNTTKYEKGFIQKPFSRKTLKNHIKKALNEFA